LGAGAVLDTYALVTSAIRKLVAQAGEETLSKALRRVLKRYLRDGKPPIDWQDPQARRDELARMVGAAGKLRAAVATVGVDDAEQASFIVVVLERPGRLGENLETVADHFRCVVGSSVGDCTNTQPGDELRGRHLEIDDVICCRVQVFS